MQQKNQLEQAEELKAIKNGWLDVNQTIDALREYDCFSQVNCSVSVKEQIEELKALKDGWFDGQGKSFAVNSLDWVLETILYLQNTWDVPTPFLYPDPDEAIRVEWDGEDNNVVMLVFDMNKQTISLFTSG